MKINEWCKAVHEVAVAHGWWETEVDPYTAAALMHSELSEALEEYRNGRPTIYCGSDSKECETALAPDSVIINGEIFNTPCKSCKSAHKKPEGIAVELADCAIRIMDYLGGPEFEEYEDPEEYLDFDAEEAASAYAHYSRNMKFCEALCSVHRVIDGYIDALDMYDPYRFDLMRRALYLTLGLMRSLLPPETRVEDVVAMKHEYNKTRPYRHGGKVC